MPTLLYIGQNPGAGTGSPILILRHLRRFAAAGWRVTILAEYGGDYSACHAAGWSVRRLRHRRWWWPPYRPGSAGLSWLRLRLLATDAMAGQPRPDAILGYLASHTSFSGRLAVHAASVSGAPLHLIVHDDPTAFPAAQGREAALHRQNEAILRHADTAWFVSPELAARYPVVADRSRVLLPIPEGWSEPATWRPERSARPALFYAGFVWPEQLPLLARLARVARTAGAELHLLAPDSRALRTACAAEGMRWHPALPNREALAKLVAEASALLVSYADTVAEMPWSATSFPSKLAEYCHLGLPLAIVAPPGTAVMGWARRRGFLPGFDPKSLDGFERWLTGLRERSEWERRADEARGFARSDFDPAAIHAILERGLVPGTARRAA